MISSILLSLIKVMGSDSVQKALISLCAMVVQNLHSFAQLQEDFREMRLELQSMQEFLEAAEATTTAGTKGMDAWVYQVRNAAYKVEDIIDELLALKESRSGGGLRGHGHNALHFPADIPTAHRIANDIKEVTAEIRNIYKRRKSYDFPKSAAPEAPRTGSSSSPSFSEGESLLPVMDQKKDELLERLMGSEQQRMVVSVWGMGGLGKTTLVRAVYNHSRVKNCFKYRAWIPVSQFYSIEDILRRMAEELQGTPGRGAQLEGRNASDVSAMRESTLLSKIITVLADKRYLIVFDDVWKTDDLNKLCNLLPCNTHGSRILVTTRDKNVASIRSRRDHVLPVEALPYIEASDLFFKAAFGTTQCPQQFEDSAEKIIKKCEGLPLAILEIGRVMSSKRTRLEWENMHKCLRWELDDNEMLKNVKQALMLSYHDLPTYLKRCFLYCSLFPGDYLIKTKRLIRLWIAEGLVEQREHQTMEEVAEHYIEHLTSKSMLQVIARNEFGKPRSFRVRVHYLMRELALTTSTGEIKLTVETDQLAGLVGSCRRLSILDCGDSAPTAMNLSRLRTVLVFAKNPSFMAALKAMCASLKFLRVLDLRGAPIEKVPNKVFDLFNLRYLSLRKTGVSEIPSTLAQLYNLQTLDLWRTSVTNLPREILKLRNLRHLHKEDIVDKKLMYMNLGGILRGQEAASRIWDLRSLQTLRTIKANQDLVTNLGSLKQLRSLGITDLKASHGNALCGSISKLNNLLRLSIKASANESLVLDGLSSPPPHLRKLILNGCLERVPEWFYSLHSLTHMYLIRCRLGERKQLVESLQGLRSLMHLKLEEAYDSRWLFFNPRSFPKLETLYLRELRGLSKLVIENGAMPELKALHLCGLKSLSGAEGIEHLAELRDLWLKDVPASFDRTRVPLRVVVRLFDGETRHCSGSTTSSVSTFK